MTFPSDFQPGDRVFETLVWWSDTAGPSARIREATLRPAPTTGRPLLVFEDGRADLYWPTTSLRIFATRDEAVAHCREILVGYREKVQAAIDELSGDPARSGDAVGIAQPEVAR